LYLIALFELMFLDGATYLAKHKALERYCGEGKIALSICISNSSRRLAFIYIRSQMHTDSDGLFYFIAKDILRRAGGQSCASSNVLSY